jgi:hypothetical protein
MTKNIINQVILSAGFCSNVTFSLSPFLTALLKNQLKLHYRLNVRSEYMKLPEENIGEMLQDILMNDNYFVQEVKAQID